MTLDFDPPETITVGVTQEDISFGVRGHCGSCPIARALHRMFPHVDEIMVSTLEFALQNLYADDAYYVCPAEAAVFINRFDAGEWVEPFTFTARRT